MSFKLAAPEDKLGVSETGVSISDYKMSAKLADADDKLGVSEMGLSPAVKEKPLKFAREYQEGLQPLLVYTTEDGREVLQVRPFGLRSGAPFSEPLHLCHRVRSSAGGRVTQTWS
jgi:hypothetical protein